MSGLLLAGFVKVCLVLILISEAFILTRRHIFGLFNTYRAQSILIAAVALFLFFKTGNIVLLYTAILTVLSKCLLLPYILKKAQKSMHISHDVEFRFLQPSSSIFISIFIILMVHIVFSKVLTGLALSNLFYIGSVLGVSLTLIGMMILFTRKQIISKMVGYLTMENGVVLFGLFISELPLLIEVFILMDLIMLVVIAGILSFGVTSTIEEFHVKLNPLRNWFNEGEES
ncbi:MAG: hydrogenase subunit [Candidatus Margulisiibacteriota bacterium]|jgi:hydrogenase-4 component E